MSDFRLVFFDDENREQFLPLAWTRPLADFRMGIYTIREKWEKRLRSSGTDWTAAYLRSLYSFKPSTDKQNIWINSRVIPTGELAFEVLSLQPGEALIKGELLIAANAGNDTETIPLNVKDHADHDFSVKDTHTSVIVLQRVHDIFLHNGQAIHEDFELLKGQTSYELSKTNTVIGDHAVFVSKNVSAECCTFNTTKGPIFIGENAELMEGGHFRGPLAICEDAVLKMAAKIYGDTTIGPGCKVGGEVSNSVFFGNSNKGHDGFIGNSVIGEWCNLGADTNCSNLKNNYGEVSVWNYAIGGYENTGLQFHGVVLGDHTKCGINTMLNTGTVAGICANIFGSGFTAKFVPDFSWGGSEGFVEHQPEKAFETISQVYKRRNKQVSPEEIAVLKEVFAQTKKYRK